LQKVVDLDSSGAALSPDLMAIAYNQFSGSAPGFYDKVTVYDASIDGAAAVEIDSRAVGTVGVPFSVVWRPMP